GTILRGCRRRDIDRKWWPTDSRVIKRSEIRQTIDWACSFRQYECPDRRKTRKIVQALDVVAVESEIPYMSALAPRDGVRKLYAALVLSVIRAEVVPELEIVLKAEIWLAGHPEVVVVPPGVLHQHAVDQVGPERTVERAKQRLIANVKVAPTARHPD